MYASGTMAGISRGLKGGQLGSSNSVQQVERFNFWSMPLAFKQITLEEAKPTCYESHQTSIETSTLK